jgi:ABC-type polysaccharide/polyol phosphate export permease
MVGILPWNFFAQSLMMSTSSIIDNGSLIRKISLPMEVFPIATVLFNLAQYLLALIVFFPMALLFFRISVAWSWIAFVPVLVLQILFTAGLCFIFSTATVFYRDIKHFTEILLMLLFWLTPIIYDIQTVPDSLRTVLYMNPVSYFILAYQDVLYRNAFISLDQLMVLLVLTFLSLVLGYSLFLNCKVRFAEEV